MKNCVQNLNPKADQVLGLEASSGFPGNVIRYIESHLDEELSIEDLASYVDLSQFHFCRVFKRDTGYTPYQYIVMKRVEKAKRRLASSNAPITSIAYEVGFNSSSNFIHAFKSHVGKTPSQFRGAMFLSPSHSH